MTNIKTLEELQKFISESHNYTIATFQNYAERGAKLKPIEKLWGNYVLSNSLTHFPSKRGSGKSLLCMQLCLSITQGYPEFLNEKIEKHGVCLYLDFEMSEQITQRRAYQLQKFAPNYNRKKGDDFIIYNSRKSFIEDFEIINRLICENKPILVVIDNLRNALKSVNTNSAIEMANFFSILNALKELYGFAIIIIDHLKKHTNSMRTDSDLQSGSGVKTDLSDADFILRNSCQQKDLRILKRIKSRLVEEDHSTKLIRLNPKTLWFELVAENVNEAEHIGLPDIQDKEELKDVAFDMYSKGNTLEQIADAMGKSKSTIQRYIKERENK